MLEFFLQRCAYFFFCNHLTPYELFFERIEFFLLGACLFNESPFSVGFSSIALKFGQNVLSQSNSALHALYICLYELIFLRQLRQLCASEKEAVLVFRLGTSKELPRSILTQDVHGIIHLDVGMIADGIEFLSLRRDRFAISVFDLPGAAAIRVYTAFDVDGVAIQVGSVSIGAAIAQSHTHFGRLRSLKNKVLETTTATRSLRFATQRHGDGCEDRTFATAIVTNNEIDAWSQGYAEISVTHKVDHIDTLDDAHRRRLRGHRVGIWRRSTFLVDVSGRCWRVQPCTLGEEFQVAHHGIFLLITTAHGTTHGSQP